jgi:hypothetical protein
MTTAMNGPRQRPDPDYPPEVQRLLKLAGDDSYSDEWLTGAESAIEFIKENANAERVVLYANLPHVAIHGVLAPLRRLSRIEQTELLDEFVAPGDRGWRIEHAWGEGRPDRVHLAPPFGDDAGPLAGGEMLVFLRFWSGSQSNFTEISQKLVHALDLCFVDERNAYCRLDERGDIEDVIRIFEWPGDRPDVSTLVTTIGGMELYEYARLSAMGVVFFFDFTRYAPGFLGWSHPRRFEQTGDHLSYNGGVQAGAGSYARGRLIVIPPTTTRDIARRYRTRRNSSG